MATQPTDTRLLWRIAVVAQLDQLGERHAGQAVALTPPGAHDDDMLDLGDVAGALLGASVVAWGCLVRSRRAGEAAEPEWETIEQQDERTDRDQQAQRALSALTWVYEVDPAKMPPGDLNYPASFFFPRDFAPTKPPVSLVDWWAWAHASGGHDLRTTKILITLQGLDDVAITIGIPTLDHQVREDPHGVVCLPEGAGGGGPRPRTYEIDLGAAGGPSVVYADRRHRPRDFVLGKGQTEQIEVIAYADSGLHEWTLQLPVTVDGVRRVLDLDLRGGPFVTVGASAGCRRLMWSGGDWT